MRTYHKNFKLLYDLFYACVFIDSREKYILSVYSIPVIRVLTKKLDI